MKIFLTGASGLLGHALAVTFLKMDWEVHASSHAHPPPANGFQKESINGLFHWAGADKINRWEMGLLIAEKLGVPEPLLQKTLARNFSQFRNRPLDLSMDSSKLKAQVQTEPAPFKNQLAEIVIPGR